MARASLGAILHFAAVRLRVEGQGNLRVRVMPNGNIGSQTLVPLAMSSNLSREETIQCNIRNYAAQIEVKTTDINERFIITTIRVFAKESSTGYPQ